MDQTRFTVNVQIDNIILPMTVATTEQEAIVRKAASNVNQQLRDVRQRYKKVPNENYYHAMVMLNAEIKALSAEQQKDTEPLLEILDELGTDIDKLIRPNH